MRARLSNVIAPIEPAVYGGTNEKKKCPHLRPYAALIRFMKLTRPDRSTGSYGCSAAGASIRALPADDHTIVRSGVSQILNDQPDIDIVAEHGRATPS
jgi:hypothetical protein